MGTGQDYKKDYDSEGAQSLFRKRKERRQCKIEINVCFLSYDTDKF